MPNKQFEHIQSIRNDFYEGSERLKRSSNNSIRTLADDLYNKHTHFIFELIQNAEDNTYDAQNTYLPYISFRLTETDPTNSPGADGALIIENNEVGFNRDNVDAICEVGATTKDKRQGYIGEKGIGFKSVFRVTQNPHIFSNGYHFCLPEHDEETGIGYIVPQWVPTVPEGLDLSKTHIILPLTKKKDFGYEEIESMLQDIEPEVILFLSTLQEIQIKTDTGDDFTILKDDSNMPEVQVVVEGKKQAIDFSNSDDFLVCTERYDRPADIHHEKRAGIESRDVTIGFPLDENSTAVGKIFAYLPVRSGTGFPFLINADFILPSSREDIHDVPWNRNWLMECVAVLIVRKLLPLLKERELLSVGFLESLTKELNNLVGDEKNLFYPVFSKLRQTFTGEELFPTNDGSFVSAKNAVLTRSDAVRNLLTHTQLGMFMSPDVDDASLKWLSAGITFDRTPNLRRYIMEVLGIEEVTPDMFARRLSDTFLASQSDEWFIKFYKFLFQQPALWRSKGSVLQTKPILRLQDGTQVHPPQDGLLPTAYLSVSEEVDALLPVIKWNISQDEDVYRFLKALGVQECDIVAEVIETVLPKYRQKSSKISISEHRHDFAKIRRAYKTDSSQKKSLLKEELRETPFIRAEKPDTDGNVYFKPDHIYFATDILRLYFTENPYGAFVNFGIYLKSDRALFTDLGVVGSVRVRRKEADSHGYVRSLEKRANYMRGLDGFDLGISVDGLQHALGTPTSEKSVFVWNHVVVPNTDCIRGIIEKSTQKTYSKSSLQEIVSHFGRLLIDNAWLPDSDGNMHKPSEITLEDLPDSFHKNEELARQLGMRVSTTRIVNAVAPMLDVSPDILNGIVNASPETVQQIKSLLQLSPYPDDQPLSLASHFTARLSSQRPTFPVASVPNPERRKKVILAELKDAPDQEYVEKVRSVRATREMIDPKTWLSIQYRNVDGQVICQICQEEMPFKYSGENYYFDAVEMLKGYFTKEYEAQFLALCPECSPKYRTFVKQDPEVMDALRKQLMDSGDVGDFEVPLKLGDTDANLRFVERHWRDIKAILSFYEQQSEQSVETVELDDPQPKRAIETYEPDKKELEPEQVPSSQPVKKKENWNADQLLSEFFAQLVRFVTYAGLKDLSQVETGQYDVTGVDAEGSKITLTKPEILFAFPKEKMSVLKSHVHKRTQLVEQNLKPVEAYNNQFQIANKLLRQMKESKSQVKVVTRAGYVLNGWIQHFDKDVLYMRVAAKVVIVYRHGLYRFTIEEQSEDVL